MHGGKALLIILVVGLLVAAGVVAFVPSVRPGFVQEWINKGKGYTKASSAEDALDKFKKAVEARDYQAASLYLGGDYKEFFDRGRKDAEPLATAIDDLRYATKKHGVKSPKADFVLFMIDPIPGGFKYKPSGSGDEVTAVLDWTEALYDHKEGIANWRAGEWNLKRHIENSLLPHSLALKSIVAVKVKKESDGGWRIHLADTAGIDRLRESVEYLRKNGSNITNALVELKNDVKNSAPTKENFEVSLKNKLEESK
jgi:hypothetical protein